MTPEELDRVAAALGREVTDTSTLAGGFSHETCLVRYAGGQVVARLGGPDPAIEAAIMAAGSRYVPTPRVLDIVAATERTRAAMLLEFVSGAPLTDMLTSENPRALGREVGRVVAAIGTATFDRPGFFADAALTVADQPPWSAQLADFAASSMKATPDERLDPASKAAWAALCAEHAPALAAIDDQRRLVHADINPKNILVSPAAGGWRVDAVLDWEFGYAGCPYGDAANMVRFGADYPAGFLAGFRAGFADHQPYALPEDWAYLGRVLDMFALSDLCTRPVGHPVADQVAGLVRGWLRSGVPRD
ncbi:phosphotransferase family protein [Fodinicola acaciae]|uniref:phosphotransferase family protein n=1 Tax=Fodinicola acaciae TaxID=2681555 RepID=UPI0013CFD194|nr:phosphotransferase [Fodinicola acaciae]